MSRFAWRITIVALSVGHLLVVVALGFYCLDQYYDQPCPFDILEVVLVSPTYWLLLLIGPLVGQAGLLFLIPNSVLWGIALAIPIRLWFGWQLVEPSPDAWPCAQCGYDLRASPGDCPECGEPNNTASGSK